MSRPSIHFHTDCAFFAGCENMLANLFADERLARDYELSFSYRASPAYEEGLRRRVPRRPAAAGLPVVDFYQAARLADRLPEWLHTAWRAALRLFLVKYWLIFWDAWVLYRALGRRRIDLLHVNNGGWPGAVSCLAAVFAARLRRIPRVIHVVNNAPRPYDGPDRWLDWPLDRAGAAAASVFVTGSASARGALERVLALPPGKAVSLPNGIAPRAPDEDRASTLSRLGVDGGRPVVAVVALMEERKGHRFLIESLRLVKDRLGGRAPVVVFEGTGSLRAGLERAARRLGLEHDAVFCGEERNVFNLLAAADAVALPSIGYEDFPNVILEAMSLGKPVLATRVGGVPEQIEDGVEGLLVEPADAKALAAALERLGTDAALRERLGAAARRRFERDFTAGRAVGRYLELYESLLAGGRT